jgi:L-malate glycosyltransferase
VITVLMATHNGAPTLPRVLEAYLQLQPPPGGWKLVIVENASSDSTPEVLGAFTTRLPLTVLRTGARGKNLALNLGLGALEGDFVVLTDDDAVPRPDWLCALAAASDAQPGFDLFGGTIEPLWPGQPPLWILNHVNLGAVFAVTPAALGTGPVPPTQLWGPNMGVRRRVFDLGHRFDTGIGPQAGAYIMGSEVEFTCRVAAHGHRAWFVADAVVGHIIREQQLNRDWIIQRAYRLGRHMWHQDMPTIAPDAPRLRGVPRWKYRELAEAHLARLLAIAKGDQGARFNADWDIQYLRGYLSEGAQMARVRLAAP